MIVIVACRIFVGVLTDVKVEVEEACAELPVAVPIADGVEAETADADGSSQRQDRAGQAVTSDHGFTKASHLGILLDRAGQFLQRNRIRRHDGQIVAFIRSVAARIEDDR